MTVIGVGAHAKVPRKWRPRLGLVVALMLTIVLILPLMGLFFFRIYENALIRQTEAELIGQSAVLAAVFRREVEAAALTDAALGSVVPPDMSTPDNGPFEPIPLSLDLAGDDLFPSRPDAISAVAPPDPTYATIGSRMTSILAETQLVTLAGFRLLDSHGTIIAGREDVGLSLAGVEEVRDALGGRFRALMRLRISKHIPPPIYSISRGVNVRVFAAMPVVVRGHVAGIIYASRTPNSVFKSLYDERRKVGLALLSVAVLTLLIGFAFHRTITGPIRELLQRSRAIAGGDRKAIRPLRSHGTAELAELTQGFMDMADALATRSDFIATFAAHVSHELKSPLTSIQGAAELLREDIGAEPGAMDDAARRRFLDNILGDTRYLTAIVQRLRDLAYAEAPPMAGVTTLDDVMPGLRADFPGLAIKAIGNISHLISISGENLSIILSHLADNSAQHGASIFEIELSEAAGALRLMVRDDGPGISINNQTRIFDSFFTTRRTNGGTGMGLPIVRAMLRAHGATINLRESAPGTTFELMFPITVT